MKLLRVCNPLQDLCFIISISQKYLEPVLLFPELKCNIAILLHVYRDFSEKVQQPKVQLESKSLLHDKLSIINNLIEEQ